MKIPYLLGVVLVLGACTQPYSPQATTRFASTGYRAPQGVEVVTTAYRPAVKTLSADTPVTVAASGRSFVDRPDVQRFIREMSARHNFSAARLEALFSHVRLKSSIIKAMDRQTKPTPWYRYRKKFLNAKRIQGGVRFWRNNAATLSRASRVYGVPPEIIVAIIGVETQYGGNMGSFRVLDALSTLAFDYPRRAPYFRKELENFLLLSRSEGISPLKPRGSYAGAMGYGQFMPSSYLTYGVDFDNDGHRDLWSNRRDAIGSVANYFKGYGWRFREPVVIRASARGDASIWVADKLGPPNTSMATWQSRGVIPQKQVRNAQLAMLLKYEKRNGLQYWLGFHNFYVITRYNRSRLYAMAVYQLSQAIRRQYQRASNEMPASILRVAQTN